jgi:hypothetical protein
MFIFSAKQAGLAHAITPIYLFSKFQHQWLNKPWSFTF